MSGSTTNLNGTQITINVNDVVPPENFATVDKGNLVGTVYTKEQENEWRAGVKAEIQSGIKGTLKITDTAPTVQGLYILSDVGTYTNLGGLVTTANKLNYAYFDGTTWSKVEVAIQNGKSAYEVAVANGFVGTEAQWLASLKPAVLQTMGASTTDAMSQKAVTDEFGKVIYINDAFTATDTDVKIYDVEPTTEFFGGAAFGILGSNYTGLQNFTKLIIKTRASDNAAIPTQIKLRIRMDVTAGVENYFEPVIYEQTKNVDFSINKTQDLTFSFPNIENPNNKDLFIEIVGVDGKISCFGTAVTGKRVMYNGTINGATVNATFSMGSVLNIEVYRPAKLYRLKETSLPIIEETPEVEISLPDKIYAVVGDTLQLFYRGIIKAVNPYNYNIVVNCAKGNQYNRYFEFTPVAGDVGTTSFQITVKDNLGNEIATKACSLITKAAASPASLKSILSVGDSITNNGAWPKEAQRRLTGTGGLPVGKALTNIAFKGRMNDGGSVGWEGTGGWTWYNYIIQGETAYKFTVSGVTNVPLFGRTYTNNGQTFTVRETNITAGSGTIRCTATGAPSASGVLTRTSGYEDVTINFSSAVAENMNPFWNAGALDFDNYVNLYMGGAVDVVYFLLSWNGLTPNKTDFTSIITNAKILINHIHSVRPSVKIKIMGIQLPSLNGGMGYAYGANGGYADLYGMVKTVLNLNKAYQDWANEPAYSSFLEFVNVSAQFDSENNMPEADKAVNSRSSKTEKVGTNGVHPADSGYYQIADVVYRNFVANFCQ